MRRVVLAIGLLITLVCLFISVSPLTVFAVSYSPAELYHTQGEHAAVMKGGMVFLFHSGTAEVRHEIHVGDILTVYHIDASCEVKEVGKIRVLSYIGEIHLKGEVVEGEIRSDDIAKKGNVSCLVISAAKCNQ